MPFYIELNMVIPAQQAHIYDSRQVSTNDEEDNGEDDGVVQLHQPSAARAEPTMLVTVNSAHVKSLYARKKRQDGSQPEGTRINFANGTGMAVTNPYAEVRNLLVAAAN